MFALINSQPPVDVPEVEYQRLLGYPKNHVLSGRPRELADAARNWFAENGRPWIYAREIPALEWCDKQVILAGTEFSSRQLRDLFAASDASRAVLVAVSAGRECEEYARQLWQESKPDEYFFLEMFGSAVVEQLVALANGSICAWADAQGQVALPHYSPGYSGWDIADQTKLMKLLRAENSHPFPGELDVLESGMLRPKKSLLAVVGVTGNREKARPFANLVPCENCALPGCKFRRAPHVRTLPQIENFQKPENSGAGQNVGPKKFALTRHAKYTVNARALEKWSQERLRLNFLPDGSIEAHFRYEGTTCSNLGRALEFDYHITLGAAGADYRILETRCAPATGDNGHAQQCEYLSNAEALMRSIATEKPLRGQPLNDVLTWARPSSPSGCFCDLDRRNHKWGLVLEVIHFALARREQAVSAGTDSEIRFSM